MISPTRPRLHRRLGRAFSAAWRQIRGSARSQAFAGAGSNRLLMDWIMQARSADEEIKGNLRTLRARARQLGRDNGYVKRYFRLLQNNVVGPKGILLHGRIRDARGEFAKPINKELERAWGDWSSAPVTVDGRLTLRRLEQLLIKTIACDGEAFVRIWRGGPRNRFGLALQPIDADLIDEHYNRPRQGSRNEIRMGIEVDALGAVVGYHVSKHAGEAVGLGGGRYFVPGAEMLHLYSPDRVNQTRGVTWLHAIMVPAHMLAAYEESEAVAARVASAKMGFWEKSGESLAGDLSGDPQPATTEANPGTFEIGPAGYTFQSWTPEHPTSQFSSFVKQIMRRIASGISVFYNTLANDAERVTYSSLRGFSLIERDDWRALQQDFIEIWRRPLYREWVPLALISGELALPVKDPALYQAVQHRTRGWAWVDPEKEVKAAVLEIENGLNTRTAYHADRGRTLEEVFDELASENELAEKKGISITSTDEPEEAPPAKVAEEDEDEVDGDRTLRAVGEHLQ